MNDTTTQEQLPPCPRVKLIPIKESWTCPSELCGIQNTVFAYERANGDKPSYANCTNCGVKVELGIPRRAEAASHTEAHNLEDVETVALEEIAADDNEDSHVRIARRVLQSPRPTRTAIFNLLSRWTQSDDCGCTHEQETCCAKVGEPCAKCEAALLLAASASVEGEKCPGCGHDNVSTLGICQTIVRAGETCNCHCDFSRPARLSPVTDAKDAKIEAASRPVSEAARRAAENIAMSYFPRDPSIPFEHRRDNIATIINRELTKE